MTQKSGSQAIPGEAAARLCSDIRRESGGKWYTLAGMLCGVCLRCSRGDTAQMLMNCQPGLRGCSLVNAQYDRMMARQGSAY